MKKDILVSVVMPAFNEEKGICSHLEKIQAYCRNRDFSIEVVVVDDGSRDRTSRVVRDWSSQTASEPRFSVRLITLESNQGKGNAVKTGLLAAQGGIRGFTDADGATPIEELDRLLPAFDRGHEVVIGSRAKASQETQVKDWVHRQIMGRVFNFVLQAITRLKDAEGHWIKDTQCGFKWFTERSAQAIFPKVVTKGFAFDVEVLYLAKKMRLAIAEVPVNWADRRESRVNLFADPFKMLWQILKIPFIH